MAEPIRLWVLRDGDDVVMNKHGAPMVYWERGAAIELATDEPIEMIEAAPMLDELEKLRARVKKMERYLVVLQGDFHSPYRVAEIVCEALKP